MMNIQLQSQYIASVFGLLITNTFFTSLIVTLILVILASIFYRARNSTTNICINGIRILVFEFLKFVDSITGDRTLSKRILPLITTIFVFIVTANLIPLIPGFLGSFFLHTSQGQIAVVRSPNSDLTTTLALAFIAVFSIQFFSIQILGIKKYIGRFLNISSPIKFILGFFEMISECVRILSFSFRLFGNIFAGETLLLVMAFLVPYIIPLPFMVLEVFVGVIQAFVFAALTLTFIKTSTIIYLE